MAPNPDDTEEAHQTLNVFVESPRFGIQDGGDGEQAALQLLGVTRLLLGVPEGVVDGAVKEVKLQLSWSRILRQPVLAARPRSHCDHSARWGGQDSTGARQPRHLEVQ